MTPYQDHKTIGCAECTKGAGLGFDFTMAFQPIVNTTTKEVFAQEALGISAKIKYQSMRENRNIPFG